MNADSILMRLSEVKGSSLSERELKALTEHIAYLEELIGCLLQGISEAKVRVNVPFKTKPVQSEVRKTDYAQTWGDESA